LKKVRVEEAEGLTLAHDVTEIIPGKKKDVAFRRGAIIRKGDVERLLDLGKRHIFVTDGSEKEVHEDEAAGRIARSATDDGMELLPPREGKVSIRARIDGLVRVNRGALHRINGVQDILFTTVPDGYPAKAGDLIAATRIIPLSISERALRKAEEIGAEGIIRIRPFAKMKDGLVVTGNEVYEGRIPDGSHLVQERLETYGLNVIARTIVPDDTGKIKEAILGCFAQGADLVITTGGLSVDPDDVTREGIEATKAKVLLYGAPVFPGAMFLVARLKGRYILGAPACVYYSRQTILDLVLPIVLAGEKITRNRIMKLAHGGLCLNCERCNYPNCFFGRGM
jgi:molybdenum cofactor synthesis domain-containing protein